MKNIIFFLIILFTVIIGSCGGYVGSDDQEEVQDSLGYEKLLGTYIFKPTYEQAERLRLDIKDSVILRITLDSSVIEPEKYFGRYYINKMILMPNSLSNEAYSSTWEYHYSNQMKINFLKLKQPHKTINDLEYRIERSSENDTLHIAGYADDSKYEIMRVVDFKKIK